MGSIYGGSDSSGSGGGSIYGRSTPTYTPRPSSSSGGGGFHIGGPLGSVLGVAGNALGQGADIIHSVPHTIVSFPSDAKYLWDKGFTENLGTPWDDKLPFYHKNEKPDPRNIVQQQAGAVSKDIVQLRQGNWHYFATHPLNPILDVASVSSVGGKLALPLAGRGALGARAAEIAQSERLLRVGDHAEALRESQTLQGRIRQGIYDRYSEAHPDMPIIGANIRMQRILSNRAASASVRAGMSARAFQRVTKALTPDEIFSYHVAAEGVPLEDRVAYYQAQLVEQSASSGLGSRTRTVEQYLGNLQAPGVAEALANPRAQFVAALEAGRELEGQAGQRLMDTGQLSAETRTSRAGRVQETMTPDRAPELTTNLVNPELPPPFRFPHVGDRKTTAKFYRAPGTEQMLGKAKTLTQLKHNAAIRLRNALFLTDPTRVLTSDFLQTMRHEEIIQMQKEALVPISQDLSAEYVGNGFKPESDWYFRPSFDRKTTAPIDRAVRESEGLTQDQAILDSEIRRAGSEKVANGVVSKDLNDLLSPGDLADANDLHNLEKLRALGIRRVPAAFGKDFAQQYTRTHWAVRFLVDRPLDVWRAITLNYRPAWMVNNFVGNAVMGLATYGPKGAAAYLRVLLATERGEEKVRSLFGFSMKQPITFRRKYARVFDEVAPELHSAGLYGTQSRVTHPGIYEGKLAGFLANPAVRVLGFAPKQVGKLVMGVGHGVTRAEILFAEDTGREAAFIAEAGGDLAKIRKAAKSAGEGNLNLAEALQRMDRKSVEKAVRGVNDALGDFNDLSHFERSVIRRVIPFYSWFKVITKVSGKYAARYPARLLLLKNIQEAQNRKGEPVLPEWLAGALRIGGPHNGVQTVISTAGINPYETIPQVLNGGAGSVLSPFLTAGVVGMTGRNPTFGNQEPYYGLGANNRGGWLGQLEQGSGSLVEGLAPARVYSQTTKPYKGHAYAPHTYARAGPVAINDFLLQYLGLPIRHVKVDGSGG